jgi:hypothetical protein
MDEARAAEAVWWGESELQDEREQPGSVWRQQTSNTSKTRGEGATLTRTRFALDPKASEDEEDEEGSGAEEEVGAGAARTNKQNVKGTLRRCKLGKE